MRLVISTEVVCVYFPVCYNSLNYFYDIISVYLCRCILYSLSRCFVCLLFVFWLFGFGFLFAWKCDWIYVVVVYILCSVFVNVFLFQLDDCVSTFIQWNGLFLGGNRYFWMDIDINGYSKWFWLHIIWYWMISIGYWKRMSVYLIQFDLYHKLVNN